MNYYIIIVLAAAHASGATHAGITQPPKIGGDWLFDLLAEPSPGDFTVVQQDCTAPSSPSVTSLSELTAAQAATDINAHLGLAA